MVLTVQDMVPYKDSIAKLKKMMKEECAAHPEKYHPDDVKDIDNDDITYCRVLMTKKNNVDQAFAFGTRTLKWRKDFGVHDITIDQFPEEILSYKALHLYFGDKEGNIMLIFNVKDHKKNFIPQAIVKKYIVFWVDVIFKLDRFLQATIILNLKGASLMNLDIDLILQFLDVFKNYYPQAVAHILVVGMHWIFEAAYKIIKPLMPEEFVDRLKFVDKQKVLEEYLDMDKVGPELGGNLKLDPPPVFINYKKYVVDYVKQKEEESK